MRSQLRSVRDENARILKRLERLEMDAAVRPSKPGAAAKPPGTFELAAIPSLTVVKLKPKVEPKPSIATRVSVVEPSPDALEALVAEPASDDDSSPAEDPSIADRSFEEGVGALRTGNIQGGVDRLRQFSRDRPKHPKADNALYLVAVGQAGLDDFDGAAATLEALLREYPAGDAVLDAMLKLAECRSRQGRPKDAKAVYSEVIQRFPGTAAAAQAEQKLAQLLARP